MTHSLSGAPRDSSASFSRLNNNQEGKRAAMGSSRSDDDGGGPGSAAAANGGNGNHLAVPDNGSAGHRPHSPVAETLFRKDLISAMKLPDNEPLTQDDYWVATDTWKQEWEKGVQVPVKPQELKEPHVSRLKHPPHAANRFQL